jgi:hypothetical protein
MENGLMEAGHDADIAVDDTAFMVTPLIGPPMILTPG